MKGRGDGAQGAPSPRPPALFHPPRLDMHYSALNPPATAGAPASARVHACAAQFLCHYFESALLHGLRPTVLGWHPRSWNDVSHKPWTYHLGAKLLLPLHYLEACNFADDVLVVFTDQDVVFQVETMSSRRARRCEHAPAHRAAMLSWREAVTLPATACRLAGRLRRDEGCVSPRRRA